MADISTLAERFVSNMRQDRQPINEMINARLQRIQELERVRLEHASEHTTNAGDGDSRHSRRDRFIRQAGQRSTERPSFASNIQRTPLRSQSFENTSLVTEMDEDTQSFRNMFESSRQNLFGPRPNGSSESLNGRRTSDTPLSVPRATFQTGSESGSGSSTPRSSLPTRPPNDFTSSLAEAFSNIRSAMVRSDSSSSLRESRRSSSITRESSSASNLQRFALTNNNGSTLTRSSSVRETRRESRFRRRTIQGVDSNISRAIELERSEARSPSVSRSISPLVVDDTLTSTTGLHGNTTVTQTRESTRTTSSYSSSSISAAYSSRHPKKVDLFPEDGIAVLGLEDEKEIFVDNKGKVHWLKKTHPLIRSLKKSNLVPEIVHQSKLAITSGDSSEGFVAAIEGDVDARYSKLKELVSLARMRDGHFEDGDFTDSAKALSLLEVHKNDDSFETVDIDEKFKSFSLYSEPRPRQDIEKLISTKEVLPIYHGIPHSELPQEIKDLEPDKPEKDLGYRTFENYDFDSLINSGPMVIEQKRFHAQFSDEMDNDETDNGSSASYSRTGESHEASETYSDRFGNVSSRHGLFRSQTQQAEIRNGDSVSNIFHRQAEARRQQLMTSRENGVSLIQRRAEERRQQYLAEQQRNENGTTTSSTRSESSRQQYSSETRTGQNGSAIQSQSEERHQQSFSRETSSDNGSSSVRHVQRSSTIRQTSSQSNIVRQSSQSHIDNSDIHSEVNLVMERLHLMQDNPSEPLDASHLDYEEMLMIQKALADNPSPSYSPVAFETENVPTDEVIDVSDEDKIQSEQESSTHFQPIEEIRSDTVITEDAAVSPSNNNSSNEMTIVKSGPVNLSDSNFSSEASNSRSGFVSARQSVITHKKVVDDDETAKQSTMITEKDSAQEKSAEKTAEETVTEAVEVESIVKESRTPRYQRLPSEGSEGRLPLPSMDWSPLERSNSPLSPSRFSFEDKKTENTSSASSTVSNSSGASSKFTVPKSSKSSPETNIKSDVHSELTIEIPSYSPVTSPHIQSEASSADTQNLTNQNEGYAETVTLQASPLIKSPGANLSSSSEAPSPAGSETVTTVFEEFVQTVPYSVLMKMKAAEEEDSD